MNDHIIENGGILPFPRLWTRWERRVWLLALFLACAIAYSARATMPLCIVEISKKYGWNKTESGAVLSAFFWGYTLTQVLGGYLSDRFGAELVMTLAMIGWTSLTVITPLMVQSWMAPSHNSLLFTFVVLRMLTGCVQGLHFPSMNSLLPHRVPPAERAFSLSFATSGSHFGTLSIGVFGSVLLQSLGWMYPFYFIGILGFTWVTVMWFLFLADNWHVNTTSVYSKSELVKSVPWCTLFQRLPFWAVVIGQFCHTWVFFLLFSWLPTYFKESFPNASDWVFNAVPWIISIPCQWFSGWLADYLVMKGYPTIVVRKSIQTLSFCGAGGSLVLMSLTGTNYYMALFCTSASIAFCAFHHSGVVVNVQDIAPMYAGSVFGLINTAGAIPGFIAVYVAGYLLQISSGSWAVVFNSTAAICFVGSAVFAVFATADKIV
jgi:ACS family sodium-dependent inorganic phosphate cotransporter-like MFS transporter 9